MGCLLTGNSKSDPLFKITNIHAWWTLKLTYLWLPPNRSATGFVTWQNPIWKWGKIPFGNGAESYLPNVICREAQTFLVKFDALHQILLKIWSFLLCWQLRFADLQISRSIDILFQDPNISGRNINLRAAQGKWVQQYTLVVPTTYYRVSIIVTHWDARRAIFARARFEIQQKKPSCAI